MKELVIAAPLIALFSSVNVWAQGPPASQGLGIASLVGNLGIMGVLVWHLWYHTTRTYPDLIATFQREAALLRQAFEQEQEQSRAIFLREQAALRESNARETNELRAMLLQSMTAMRTAVHDVRDTAQVALSKVEAAKAQPGDSGTNLGRK